MTNSNLMYSPQNPPQLSMDVNEAQQSVAINSMALFGLRKQLTIQHQGELYILRQTRAGKLILTK